IIKFFLHDLTPVDNETLEPEDRNCHICMGDFTTAFHNAVRLPCNHILGESCIKKWLSPYAPCHPYPLNYQAEPVGASMCPICRRVFFPEQEHSDVLPIMEARLDAWDRVYAHVGIALSDRDRQARADLRQFLNAYRARGADEYFPHGISSVIDQAEAWAMMLDFSILLKSANLTPVQEQLRQSLEHVARNGSTSIDLSGQIHPAEVPETIESHEEVEDDEVESEELAEGDTEEMRFFRALFR
ncbi:hypothetical protein MMC07_006761, partial [Pseudocyphellaria aurata]|nr:hypothetical protein [Pseudocyphellaria aurata]